MHAGLRRLGHRVNRKRIERVMCERGISGVTRRRRRGLTCPAKRAVPAPDLIARDFTALVPGMKLVGDITYIPTDEGWLYLATWLDLATREIVGSGGHLQRVHDQAGAVVVGHRVAGFGRQADVQGRRGRSERHPRDAADLHLPGSTRSVVRCVLTTGITSAQLDPTGLRQQIQGRQQRENPAISPWAGRARGAGRAGWRRGPGRGGSRKC
ncbi:IS3 family transposase [Streptomyces sp. NPDC048527]|uniref:IS3 family transposase n=1 Tax=Streptomyces sp. NPDC048527 TaxID=3365568 RepID=UPI00371FC755